MIFSTHEMRSVNPSVGSGFNLNLIVKILSLPAIGCRAPAAAFLTCL